MGLDMYLNKYPKIQGVTFKQTIVADVYFKYLCNYSKKQRQKVPFEEYLNSFEYFNKNTDIPTPEAIEKLKAFIHNPYENTRWSEDFKTDSIETEIAYWRKANQIHNWFVENVQKDVDDCGYYQVTKKDLETLLNICREVKQAFEEGNIERCSKLLPTRQGFFFGQYNYDDSYKKDIEDTIEQLEKVLKETDFSKNYVVYTSSW